MICGCMTIYFADETAVCRNSHNLSKRDLRITRQMGYKHTFCQIFVCTRNALCLYSRKNVTSLKIGLLRMSSVFFLSVVKLCNGGLQQTAVQ
jgi:hypothetical protein